MSQNYVFLGVPDHDADTFYFSGFKAMDPMLMLGSFEAPIGLIPRLEVERAKQEGRFAEVLDLTSLYEEIATAGGKKTPASAVAHVCKQRGFSQLTAPGTLPASLFQGLLDEDIKVQIADGMIFPQRLVKTAKEIEGIREGTRISELAFDHTRELLAACQIARNGTLMLDGEVFTSERLRREICLTAIGAGASVCNPIAAGGLQAADCHNIGHGPLRAHEMIVVDIFPRDSQSFMFGDLSRTFVKGAPTDKQRHIYETIHQAHMTALAMFGPGADLAEIDRAARTIMEEAGYPTRKRDDGLWEGTYCGIGHGLGLDIHEPPFIGKVSSVLQPGHVMTLEPGIYIPEVGGCRIEDTILITESGCELLNKPDYTWIID